MGTRIVTKKTVHDKHQKSRWRTFKDLLELVDNIEDTSLQDKIRQNLKPRHPKGKDYERDNVIIQEYKAGIRTADIAEKYGITIRRVQQIISEAASFQPTDFDATRTAARPCK